MFDIGATELLVVAVVMILVVGPKELPGMLRNIARMVKKLRGMAGEFQSQFDDALKEAELDGVKDTLNDVKSINPMNSLKNELNPINKMMEETKSELNEEAGKVNKAIEGDKVAGEGIIEKSPPRQSEVEAAKKAAESKAKSEAKAQTEPKAKAKAKKPAAKKTTPQKTTAKKTTVKKPVAKKSAPKKSKDEADQ